MIKTILWGLLICVYKCNCLLSTVIVTGNLNTNISVKVDKNVEYIIDFNELKTNTPVRVFVESLESDRNAPAIIVIRQSREVLSWELPMIVDGGSSNCEYNDSARTLCYDRSSISFGYTNFYNDVGVIYALNEELIVTVSTSSTKTITATVFATTEDNFFLKPSTNYTVEISPSRPRFYYYGFPETNSTTSNYDTVILEIFSSNSVCMTVSLQNASCPIYDLNDDITFRGYWETVGEKGGFTISKSKFPAGFFLVFVVKGTDFDCTGQQKDNGNPERTKVITFMIKPSIVYNDYFNAIVITIFTIGVFYIIFGISLCICNNRCYVPRTMEYVPTTESEPSSTCSFNALEREENAAESVSLADSEYDTLDDIKFHAELVCGKPDIYVSDLARKKQHVLIKRSYSYLWHVLTVGLFYLLPVVQLVVTYQKVLNDTGNQDLCYYNFLCAHPLGFFSDFNHMFSNIGYILFGLLFLWITYRREKWHKDSIFDIHYGVPQHYGLYYAIGFALIMEGLLSGSYHICPNQSNFQFDTSFMYVTAVLSMIKIYQARHPDINASAYATFGILAVAILLGMIGILEANICFWIIFTILHILICFYLTAKVYYLGSCNFDLGIFQRVFRVIMQDYRAGAMNVIKPLHKSRMVLLIIGNLLNWAMAAYGIYSQADFAVYLLGLFMLNTVYYFTFYIVMKVLYKEKMNALTLLFLVISLTCAVISMYCFFHKSISWSLMPAESRYYNQECIWMGFYDYHDLWHFLSSVGMFFMFMVLLTLDDDLSHTPRNKIHVF